MNKDASMILSLRRVLEKTGEGSGVSRAVVEELGRTEGAGRASARLLLLGNTIADSLRPMVEGTSEEVSLLASLVVAAPGSSAPLVGRSGGAIASTVERWVKVKESRALEQRVLRFRSLVTSGVLGAVTAMIASLGPLIGNLSFTGGATTGSGALLFGAAAMAAISSGMLGAFMGGRRFYLNVIVALGAFTLVSVAAIPLASVPAVSLWGVK
jgi:hypothetical protein